MSNCNVEEVETTTFPSYDTVKPLKPGPKSYSDVVTGQKKSMIISTSMTRGIGVQYFNQKYYKQGTATFHRFHGGKARHIRNQVETHLHEERPDAVIILAGGNDLPTKKRNPTSINGIANQIMDIALMCKKYSVTDICISSVLPREEAYMQLRRKDLNDVLKSLCEIYNFHFINNDIGDGRIILSEHIDSDGVHLNPLGSELLAHKVGTVLNSLHSC